MASGPGDAGARSGKATSTSGLMPTPMPSARPSTSCCAPSRSAPAQIHCSAVSVPRAALAFSTTSKNAPVPASTPSPRRTISRWSTGLPRSSGGTPSRC